MFKKIRYADNKIYNKRIGENQKVTEYQWYMGISYRQLPPSREGRQ